MTPLHSVSLYLHHQASLQGFLLSRDLGWQYLLNMDPGAYHRAYVDGLCNRWLDGQYDALACLDIYRRADAQAYIDDLREQLEEYHRRTGRRIHAGVGGYHVDARWDAAARTGEHANMIFQCRRPIMDSDAPPWSPGENGRGRRPVRALVDAMIGDGWGDTPWNGTRRYMVETEWRMWPMLGPESCTVPGGFFAQARTIGQPQYSQDDWARNMRPAQWTYLEQIGMTDHSVLVSDPNPVNEPFFGDWWDRGFHVAFPVDAWRQGMVPPNARVEMAIPVPAAPANPKAKGRKA